MAAPEERSWAEGIVGVVVIVGAATLLVAVLVYAFSWRSDRDDAPVQAAPAAGFDFGQFGDFFDLLNNPPTTAPTTTSTTTADPSGTTTSTAPASSPTVPAVTSTAPDSSTTVPAPSTTVPGPAGEPGREPGLVGQIVDLLDPVTETVELDGTVDQVADTLDGVLNPILDTLGLRGIGN